MPFSQHAAAKLVPAISQSVDGPTQSPGNDVPNPGRMILLGYGSRTASQTVFSEKKGIPRKSPLLTPPQPEQSANSTTGARDALYTLDDPQNRAGICDLVIRLRNSPRQPVEKWPASESTHNNTDSATNSRHNLTESGSVFLRALPTFAFNRSSATGHKQSRIVLSGATFFGRDLAAGKPNQ